MRCTVIRPFVRPRFVAPSVTAEVGTLSALVSPDSVSGRGVKSEIGARKNAKEEVMYIGGGALLLILIILLLIWVV